MKTTILSLVLFTCATALAQDEPRDLVDELRETWQEIEELATEREQVPEGDERDVLDTRISRRARVARSAFKSLLGRIDKTEKDGGDAGADRAVAEDLMAAAAPLLRNEIHHRIGVITARHNSRERTPADEQLDLERQITRDNHDLDDSMATMLSVIEWKQTLSLDATDEGSYLDRVLEERADDLAARTDLAMRRRDEATERLRQAPDADRAAIESEVRATKEALHGNVGSLEAIVAMMDARGLDSAEPKELLIEATGNVTTDIFDVDVLSRLVTGAWENVAGWVVETGPQVLLNLLFFVGIIAVAKLIAGIARKITARAVTSTSAKVPTLLKDMLISMSGKLVLLFGIIIALAQIGIDIGPLLAGVGVAGFIVGFALQDTLSNFASGIMILLYQPFDVGDVVEAGGVAGEVSHMSVVSTTVRTFDNQILIVPNSKIWGDVIRNKTAVRTRRVDLTFGIGYDDDIVHAESVLHDIVHSHELVLADPPPTIKLHELADSSVNFVVRPWVNTADYWDVYWDITRAVKQRFDAEGISIPFPQRDVHVHEASTPSEPVEKPMAKEYMKPRETVSTAGVSADDD